jgi:hypothetical protein
VAGPKIVKPSPIDKSSKYADPVKLVTVSATVTLVIPAAELAVKLNVGEYWN